MIFADEIPAAGFIPERIGHQRFRPVELDRWRFSLACVSVRMPPLEFLERHGLLALAVEVAAAVAIRHRIDAGSGGRLHGAPELRPYHGILELGGFIHLDEGVGVNATEGVAVRSGRAKEYPGAGIELHQQVVFFVALPALAFLQPGDGLQIWIKFDLLLDSAGYFAEVRGERRAYQADRLAQAPAVIRK